MINGRRYRGAIPEATTKRQAELVENQKRIEVFEGRYGKPTGQGLLEDFIKDVYLPWSKQHKKSHYHDQKYAVVICEFFRGMAFRDITAWTIEQFKRKRSEGITERGEKRAKSTVNRELAQLSSIFSLAVDYGYCEDNPCRRVRLYKVYSRRERVISEEEERRLLAALTGRHEELRPIIILALHTGMRRNEILKLKWTDVDFMANEIRLAEGSTKSGKGRTLPMTDLVRETMLGLREAGDGTGRIFTGRGYSSGTITNRIARLCDRLGMPDVTLHTLRHTFASRLEERNVNPFLVRDLLGHSTLRMTGHYTHSQPDALREAVKKLEMEKDCHKIVTNVESRNFAS